MSDDSVSSVSPTENTTNIKRKPVSTTVFSNLPPSQPSQFDGQNSKTNYEPSYEPVMDGGKDGPLNRRRQIQNKVPQPVWLWKWEIVSLAAATAALIAIIITLRVFENKDLSHWKAPITINAVVAILSAIFKGGLALPISDGIGQLKWLWFYQRPQRLADMDRYDRASRSTWGAIVFLATSIHRVNLSPLAAFGAFLALLTLIVDPFAQASVSTQSCVHHKLFPNLVPLSMNYTNKMEIVEGFPLEPNAAMQIAVLVGLSQPPQNSAESMQSKVRCPGSNCTFTEADNGVFTTLSMCHQCKNVTSKLETTDRVYMAQFEAANRGELRPVHERNYTYKPPMHDSTTQPFCFLSTLNATLEITHDKPVVFNMATHREGNGPLGNRSFADGPWLDTTVTSFCGIFMTPPAPNCTTGNKLVACEENPFAFDCALQPCVKAFRANYSQGRYDEHELGSWPLHQTTKPLYSTYFELGKNQTYVNGTLRDCYPQTTPTDTHNVWVDIPQNQYAQFPFQHRYLWYPEECVYTMDGATTTTLAKYLGKQINNQTLTPSTGAPWLKNLHGDGNVNMTAVETLAAGLATSIGGLVRSDPDRLINGNFSKVPDRFVYAPGQVLADGTCIRVRWKFLSFPAILLVAELIFFITLVIVNWRSKWSGDWKSSNIPLMFQDAAVKWPVSHSDVAVSDEMHLHKEMHGVQARLVQDDDDSGRWKLSTSAESSAEK